MRSVNVVLPASMCAMMPMFLVLAKGTTRVVNSSPHLPAIVCKSLVGFSHFMGVFLLLNCRSLVFESICQFRRKLFGNRLFFASSSRRKDPTDRQGNTTLRTDFNRHLISSSANPTRFHFQNRLNIINGGFEYVQGPFSMFFPQDFESIVKTTGRDHLLA